MFEQSSNQIMNINLFKNLTYFNFDFNIDFGMLTFIERCLASSQLRVSSSNVIFIPGLYIGHIGMEAYYRQCV